MTVLLIPAGVCAASPDSLSAFLDYCWHPAHSQSLLEIIHKITITFFHYNPLVLFFVIGNYRDITALCNETESAQKGNFLNMGL
jgi:hypothetical protein